MTTEYFNNLASAWDAKYSETDSDKLRMMAARLKIEIGTRVLDIGSGTGVFVPYLLEKIGAEGHLTCLDPAAEMLKISQAKGFKGNIEYICASIEESGLPDRSFDAAVCYSSFPHFNDKPKALDEIARMLTPGGKLFICHTSSRSRINERHAHVPILHSDITPGEPEMKNLFEKAGFSDIVIEDRVDSYLASARK